MKSNAKVVFVPGTDQNYLVSSDGKVVNAKTKKALSASINNSGYLCVILPKKYSISRLVHRIVALGFLGPSDKTVNHINGDKLDNRLENLEYMTHSQNERHAYSIGLKSRLLDGKYEQVVEKYKSGFSARRVAQFYGVSKNAVLAVIGTNLSKEDRLLFASKNRSSASKGRLQSIKERMNRSKGQVSVTFPNGKTKIFPTASYAADAIGISYSHMKKKLRKSGSLCNGIRVSRVTK
jgi:hypothetical protein